MHLSGLIAAAYTPFHPSGELRLEVVAQQLEVFLESGVAGVFVAGTTGECHSLTVCERQELAARWALLAKGKIPVLVHVGHNSLPDARALAAHAQEIGADGIAAMAPFFFKPDNVDDLVQFLAQIAAAAPKLPFYFYDIPSMTGVRLPTARILEEGIKQIPTLAGLKFTSQDLMTFLECLSVTGGRLDCLYGHDEMLLSALALGARGAVGSSYNFAGPVYNRLIRAFHVGDLALARAEQLSAVRLIRAMIAHGGLAAGKTLNRMIGIDCGPPRAPLRDLTSDQRRALYEQVRDLPVFARELRV